MREVIKKILVEYQDATTEQFSGSALASYIRKDATQVIRNSSELSGKDFIFKGSPGQGIWAAIPWIAAFYPPVTDSATRGYYLVYLFDPNRKTCFLSVNQGATSVVEEFGTRKGLEILQHRASIIRSRLDDYSVSLSERGISLSVGSGLPRCYVAGHALGIKYSLDDLPTNDKLSEDLQQACRAYSALFYRGGVSSFGIEQSEGKEEDERDLAGNTIDERRKYRVHKSIERNPTAAKKAKQAKPAVCEACGFRFDQTYGQLGKGYIEAHHLVPLSNLEENVSISYDLVEDFALLCANCHRMIHRLDDPSDLGLLRRILKE